MTDKEVMQLALEALENMCDAQSNPGRRSFPTIHDFGKSRLACIAIKEALEQQQAEPPPEWLLIKNILDEYGLQAIDFVAEFKAAQQVATIWKQAKPFLPEAINTTQTAWRMGYEAAKAEQQAEPVGMRMPKVGDKVICLEDESLGEVVSLTGGGSPDITFDDGTRGTYLLREFAELFGYAEQRQQQAEPPPEWESIKNILDEYGLDAIAFVAAWKAAQQQAEPVQERITRIAWDERGVRTVNGIPDDAPQRPWVGLTPEEILDMFDINNVYGSKWIEFARTVEAKLKEKNDH